MSEFGKTAYSLDNTGNIIMYSTGDSVTSSTTDNSSTASIFSKPYRVENGLEVEKISDEEAEKLEKSRYDVMNSRSSIKVIPTENSFELTNTQKQSLLRYANGDLMNRKKILKNIEAYIYCKQNGLSTNGVIDPEIGNNIENIVSNKTDYNDDNNDNYFDNNDNNVKKDTKKLIADDSTVKIDEEIGQFKQSKTVGDCWLVSSIKALSETTKGAQAIKDDISKDPQTGNVTVKLKTGDSYTFTPEEISNAKSRLSTGDDDVRVLEMAVEKHRKNKIEECKRTGKKYYGNGTEEQPLYNGDPQDAVTLLAGRLSQELDSSKNNNESELMAKPTRDTYLDMIEKYPDKYSAVITFNKNDSSKNIVTDHLYTIDHVDGDNIMLVNPWNSSEKTLISRDELLSNCNAMNTVTCENNDEIRSDESKIEFLKSWV